MIKQYPYQLKYLKYEEAIYNQSLGEYEQENEQWINAGICRDEVNGSGAKISKVDGEIYQYSAVIYAPLSMKDIPLGSKIQVWKGNQLRLEGHVIRFGRDQLHVRIWV